MFQSLSLRGNSRSCTCCVEDLFTLWYDEDDGGDPSIKEWMKGPRRQRQRCVSWYPSLLKCTCHVERVQQSLLEQMNEGVICFCNSTSRCLLLSFPNRPQLYHIKKGVLQAWNNFWLAITRLDENWKHGLAALAAVRQNRNQVNYVSVLNVIAAIVHPSP